MEELLKLSLLERRILRFCASQKVTQEELTMKFKNISKPIRQQAIDALISYEFIHSVKVMNAKTNRPRTLYFTTDQGKAFLEQFAQWLSAD